MFPRSLALAVVCSITLAAAAQTALPSEPVEIGTQPQLFVDQYIVDNTWTLRYKTQHIDRVFHAPEKHLQNPLIKGAAGYVCIAHDAAVGQYHLWYQTHIAGDDEAKTQYAIAYARSQDGLDWELPSLGLHEWNGSKDNNVVIRGKRGRASSPWLLDVPVKDRRGYKYLLMYRDADGSHLVGTNDGVHFDPASDQQIQHLHSDTQNAIVYDPHQRQYVMYCRAKAVYRAGQTEMIDTGESRRVARIANQELWSQWPRQAANILLPDELDTKERYHAFYGMPTTVYAGTFFGFVWPFRWNDRIHTELAWSRDGIHFERHPLRPKLIDYGPPGAWDDEMVFASSWAEVGDEWRIYYAGWDGPHNTRERTGGIGLATLRKEGFVSLRGPAGGGVVCTRVLTWPGGKLLVNATTGPAGQLTVRISDADRKVLPGFDYADCVPFTGDSTAVQIAWKSASIEDLQGQDLRLEIFIQDADLYSFRATGE
ncbi:MAG TPA: hypothetical protein VFV87_02355 [Pirellulaceae bacterium]|nr:hypothetical protein [Pirellulaceae bacterium]